MAITPVGGANASPTTPATTTAPVSTSTPADTTTPAVTQTAGRPEFGDALKAARGVASAPQQDAGAPTSQGVARAKQLGLAGGATAFDVLGHGYARVEGSSQGGSYVNTSGNARSGQSFSIVERAGRTFHVYAEGAVEVSRKSSAPPAA